MYSYLSGMVCVAGMYRRHIIRLMDSCPVQSTMQQQTDFWGRDHQCCSFIVTKRLVFEYLNL